MVFSAYTLGALMAVVTVAVAQQSRYESTTPIPILRQINKHNDDGSYSYGYEGGDGSFKIETKYPNGEVYGKYGYVDIDSGMLREIEYGATKRGFEPVGTGITVAPPTLDNSNSVDGEDDGQYREDPTQYYQPESSRRHSNDHHASTFSNFNLPQSRPAAPRQQQYQAPQPAYHAPQPAYHAPAVHHHAAPVHHAAPLRHDPNQFHGHPATNIDIASGSYTINYSG